MNPRDSLPIVALATGVALLAVEVRRVTRERDALSGAFLDLVNRMADKPDTVLTPTAWVTPIDSEPAYVSDLPYHDSTWDDFAKLNAQLPSEEDDE